MKPETHFAGWCNRQHVGFELEDDGPTPKHRAVEDLVKPAGLSDESVTNEKGKVAALP